MAAPELILGHMGLDGRAHWVERTPIPSRLRQGSHVLRPEQSADELNQLRGRAGKPERPIAFWTPGGMVTFVLGVGVTEMAELTDLVDRERERKPMDPDERAERLGFLPREQAGALHAERLHDAATRRRRNWRTEAPDQHFKDREVWSVPELPKAEPRPSTPSPKE